MNNCSVVLREVTLQKIVNGGLNSTPKKLTFLPPLPSPSPLFVFVQPRRGLLIDYLKYSKYLLTCPQIDRVSGAPGGNANPFAGCAPILWPCFFFASPLTIYQVFLSPNIINKKVFYFYLYLIFDLIYCSLL